MRVLLCTCHSIRFCMIWNMMHVMHLCCCQPSRIHIIKWSTFSCTADKVVAIRSNISTNIAIVCIFPTFLFLPLLLLPPPLLFSPLLLPSPLSVGSSVIQLTVSCKVSIVEPKSFTLDVISLSSLLLSLLRFVLLSAWISSHTLAWIRAEISSGVKFLIRSDVSTPLLWFFLILLL